MPNDSLEKKYYVIKTELGADKTVDANVVDAYLRIFNDPVTHRHVTLTGIPFERGQVEAWVAGARDSRVEYHVARDSNGYIVGMCLTKCDPTTGFEIFVMAVDPVYRRCGIGRSLADAALRSATEKGYRAADVLVFADNREMLLLLIGMGFIPIEVWHRAKYDGTDIVRLRYLL